MQSDTLLLFSAQAILAASVITKSTGWHLWAAMLPLYALTVTAGAIIFGALYGRRNLLLLAQFVGVIVWWMMCAVMSVEFAIAVGFSDACAAQYPNATIVNVMRKLEVKEDERPHPEKWFFLNATDYFLRNCSTPDGIDWLLSQMIDEVLDFNHTLYEILPLECLPEAVPPPHLPGGAGLPKIITAMNVSRQRVMEPAGACGGEGEIARLFYEGFVQGLCDNVGIGFTQLWFFQAVSGILLLFLSGLMPGLWHSHHLPPARIPTRRDMRRFFRPLTTSAERVRTILTRPRRARTMALGDEPADSAAITAPLRADDVRAPMLPSPADSAGGRLPSPPPMDLEPAEAPSAADPPDPFSAVISAAGGRVSPPTESLLGGSIEPLIARVDREREHTCSNFEAL